MKIVIINKSDLKGGAAVVSYRLMQALREQGVDVSMLVLDKMSDDSHVVVSSVGWRDRYNFLAERLHLFLCNKLSRKNLFKVSTAMWGQDLSLHPLVREADVVILNWVNQGAMTLTSVQRICSLDKPVIWTMHDMWNCTGICHYALECEGFKSQCGKCQFLKSHDVKDLSTRIQKAKRRLYDTTDIQFVAVSQWLADRCKASALLCDKPVKVIHNAFPVGDFSYERRNESFHDIPTDKIVVAMGAARLDVFIKGFDYLIEATQIIAKEKPLLASKLHLLLYGGIRDTSLLEKIGVPVTYIGVIKGVEALNDVYSHSDIVLSTSLYETFGATLVEGQACGCMAVTFGSGGQRDAVEHLQNGYLADSRSARSLVEGIEWAVEHPRSRKELHDAMEEKFSSQKIAKDYMNLINELKRNKKDADCTFS